MKNIKKSLFVLLFLFVNLSFAQEKVKDVVSDEYDRSSISVIYVSRGDSYDSQLKDFIKKYFMNSDLVTKFDLNIIPTKEIKVDSPRDTELTPDALLAMPEFETIGKEILSYWFNRQSNGEMNAALIEQRGRYNVTDQDYFNAQVAKIGLAALSDGGFELVKNSYLLLVDYSDIERTVDEKDNKKVSWSSKANVHVFKLDYTQEIYDNVMNAWIYDDDTEETKEQKNELWNNINVKMQYVASGDYETSSYLESDGGLEASAVKGYQSAIHVLETKIDTWSVASSVTDVRPIRAKIGTKEGLKNKARYRAYIYTEDENGKRKSVPRGYLRATKVAHNTMIAEGETPKSEFYQISGFKIEPGATLKQSNDLGMGLNLSYRAGSFKGYYIGIDQLFNIKTSGISQYGILNFGFDMLSEKKLNKNNIETSEGEGVSMFNGSIGYGIGIRPFIRYFEFVPFFLVGIDGIDINGEETDDDEESDESFNDKISYTGTLGVKFNMNVWYPLQLFGSVDYSMNILQGKIYEYRNNTLGDLGRKNGIGFNIGLKYIF